MKIVIRKMIEHNKGGSDNLVNAMKTTVLNSYFHENNSINLNRLRIQVQFIFEGFSLSALSEVIQSQGHKKTADIKFETPNILKCCTKGGRIVIMESKFSLPKDTKPKLVAYKKETNGNIILDPDKQTLVKQPDPQKIIFSKINNSIRFETPEQDEIISQPNILLRLVCVWSVDGEELAANEFKFQYLRHPWPRGSLCVFCDLDVDGIKQEDCLEENIESILSVEEPQGNEMNMLNHTDNTTLYDNGVNIPIEDLIEFNEEQDSEGSHTSPLDSFTVIGMDSDNANQPTIDSNFSNLRTKSRIYSSDSSTSNESFVIVNSQGCSSDSYSNVSPSVEVLSAFADLQTSGGISFFQDTTDTLQTFHL